ncbi:MAG: immunity 22 family protein [Myxococcales bacterium]|nr:immunity 22 family protein [Myxococcales bacterium]
MEADGYVSLWISGERDFDRVQAAFEDTYTEDGDWIPPPFALAFGFETFDPATREANILKSPTSSVREAVSGYSYDKFIAERFAHDYGEQLPARASAVALLYNFKFSGEPTAAVVDGTRWQYIGCVPYR